jgi:hypothetical protein
VLRYNITGFILKILPWCVSLLYFLLKYMNLHNDSDRSIEIRELKIGAEQNL